MYNANRKDWFRPRSYIHFDEKITEHKRAWVTQFVSNPANVSRHPFFPFLYYLKQKSKVETSEDGKREYKSGARPICYAAHLDAHVYAYYSNLLSEVYEERLNREGLSEHVIGFRKLKDADGNAKSNIHLANDAFKAIRDLGDCRVYAFDIKSFFSSLEARHLKKAWKDLLSTDELPKDHFNVFKSLVSYRLVQRDELFRQLRIPKSAKEQRKQNIDRVCSAKFYREFLVEKTEIVGKGIPQGSPISATLANLYMLSFDGIVAKKVTAKAGFYFRYCDDLLVALPAKEDFDVETFICDQLALIGLKLNPHKTDISTFFRVGGKTSFDKPIQYLGFVFDGTVISIRPGSISGYLRDLKKSVNQAMAIKLSKDRESKFCKDHEVSLKGVLEHYSQHNERTFLSYVRRAADVMNSDGVRSQYNRLTRLFDAHMRRAKKLNPKKPSQRPSL